MHIRILAGFLGKGHSGSAAYHYKLAKSLMDRGHRVSVVCFGGDTEGLDGCEILALPANPYLKLPLFWRLDALTQYWHFSKELKKSTLSEPDITIAGEHLTMRAHFEKFPARPWVYLPHSYLVRDEIKSYNLDRFREFCNIKLYEWLQRWALNSTITVRFTNAACAVLKEYYRDSISSHFEVNQPGVVLPPRSICERKLYDNKDVVKLLFVGRLVSSKNVTELLKQLSFLTDRKWTLDIVGDGKERAKLERLTKSLNLSERVYFRDFQANTTQWYEKADIFVSMSKLESFGLTLIEAMSYYLPIVAMRNDDIHYFNVSHEIVKDNINGFLLNNPADFKKCLERLLRDRDAVIKLSLGARSSVEQNYIWEKHVERYEQLFNEMILKYKEAHKAKEL